MYVYNGKKTPGEPGHTRVGKLCRRMRRGRRYVRLDLDNFNDFLPTTFRPDKGVPENLASRSPR
jgi:hypothetical protein